jgi:hypothetical protein
VKQLVECTVPTAISSLLRSLLFRDTVKRQDTRHGSTGDPPDEGFGGGIVIPWIRIIWISANIALISEFPSPCTEVRDHMLLYRNSDRI